MKKLPGVLLIDDDSTNNFLNERLLARLDLSEYVLVAESGQEALDLLSQATMPPALILLDVNMPGLSGLDFLDSYQPQRQAQESPSVVIMLTTTMDAKDLARINELQIDGLVSKPLTEEKLTTLLQLHFQAYVTP
ncbi:MAG: response regulator [Janthinobacterium lividum]